MFLVGITGGIATGKSTIVEFIKSKGIPVIEADIIAKEVVEPGKKAWLKIKKAFGEDILQEDGCVDRKKLGDLVFKDKDKRRILNKITHPEIHRAMRAAIFTYFLKGYQFIMLDVPLLFETKYLIAYMHKIIVVTCEEVLQLERLMKRNAFTPEEARVRIAAQLPLEEKCNMANFVVENSGTLEETQEQVSRILETLKADNVHWKLRFAAFSLIIFIVSIILLIIWFLFF